MIIRIRTVYDDRLRINSEDLARARGGGPQADPDPRPVRRPPLPQWR
jgi:hypothetical protein